MILDIALTRVGDKYVLGTLTPVDDPNFHGPWDCAQLASWALFQASGVLYGLAKNELPKPGAKVDAYTGYWARDAAQSGQSVNPWVAASTAGAFLLRFPGADGMGGHIAISDGKGDTVEAMGTKYGVVRASAHDRRWDVGVLPPGVAYTTARPLVQLRPPKGPILRLGSSGAQVGTLQKVLTQIAFDSKDTNYSPGGIDRIFGPKTLSAVIYLQRRHGLVPDGEVGQLTQTVIDGIVLGEIAA